MLIFNELREVKSTKSSIDVSSLTLNLTLKEKKLPIETHISKYSSFSVDLHAILKSDFTRVFHLRFVNKPAERLCYAGRPKNRTKG